GVDLWDLHSFSRLGGLPALNGDDTWGVTVSADGRRLVTTGADGTVARWDVAKKSMIGRPARATKGIGYLAAFSPDGRMFATAGDNLRLPLKPHMTTTGSFIVWDANTGKRLHTFKLRGSPLGQSPVGLVLNPDGSFLAGFSDEQAAVW